MMKEKFLKSILIICALIITLKSDENDGNFEINKI